LPAECGRSQTERGKYDPILSLAFTSARLFGRSIEAIFEPNLPPQGDLVAE